MGGRYARVHSQSREARRGPLSLLLGLVLLIALLTATALVSLWVAGAPEHPLHDITHYKYWVKLVAERGIAGGYSGEWPHTYVIYPPAMLYVYKLIGMLQQWWPAEPPALSALMNMDPFGWAAWGRPPWESFLIKVPNIAAHLALAALIYTLLWRWHGLAAAVVGATSYALNPALLLDTVYWAQPDPFYSLFLVAAFAGLAGRLPEIAWAGMALAAMAKPQAWIYLPLLAWLSLPRLGLGGTLRGIIAAALTVVAISWPFVREGRVHEEIGLVRAIANVMPVVSANSHNLWWLLLLHRPSLSGDEAQAIGRSEVVWWLRQPPAPLELKDSVPAVPPLTFRDVALLLIGAALVAVSLRLACGYTPARLFSGAGLLGFSFIMGVTGAHENHLYGVLPLLALAWPTSWPLALIYVVLSFTFWNNLALHDYLLGDRYAALLGGPAGVDARTLTWWNAWLNVVALVLWVWAFFLEPLPRRAARLAPAFRLPRRLLWLGAAGSWLGAGAAIGALVLLLDREVVTQVSRFLLLLAAALGIVALELSIFLWLTRGHAESARRMPLAERTGL
jgi:hypothetical protein